MSRPPPHAAVTPRSPGSCLTGLRAPATAPGMWLRLPRGRGKMLALLQRLRKQTRAPNDSNKPRRRLPLRRRGRAAGASGSCGGSGGSGTPVPAAPPAPVRGSPTPVLCDRGGWQPGRGVAAGTPPCPPAGPAEQCRGPGALCGGCPVPRRPGPHRRRARGQGKVDIYFCLVLEL